MDNRIHGYCLIRNGTVILNGKEFPRHYKDLNALLAEEYRQLGISYPKYFKMDRLCKLAFIATEHLAQTCKIGPGERTALVFSNRSSSLDSDRAFLKTISDPESYFPSPSLFVYTLPNIMTGELAIRHNLKGENAFFLTAEFDPQLLHDYSDLLLSGGPSSDVLAGWVDVDGEAYDAFVYSVKRDTFNDHNFSMPHAAEHLDKLYRNT